MPGLNSCNTLEGMLEMMRGAGGEVKVTADVINPTLIHTYKLHMVVDQRKHWRVIPSDETDWARVVSQGENWRC